MSSESLPKRLHATLLEINDWQGNFSVTWRVKSCDKLHALGLIEKREFGRIGKAVLYSWVLTGKGKTYVE